MPLWKRSRLLCMRITVCCVCGRVMISPSKRSEICRLRRFRLHFYVGEDSQLYHRIHAHHPFALTADLKPADFPNLPGKEWLAVPVVIGQRLIGAIILGRETEFEEQDYLSAAAIGSHVAPSVEKSILSDEAAYYLQRFALLNELAGFGGAGLGISQVIERGEIMLRRSFDAASARITLYR